jgi:hypothetical protein
MTKIEPLPGRDGILLARLIELARQLQQDAGDEPFVLALRYAQQFLELPEMTDASRLLHRLERFGWLHCERLGTKSVPGGPPGQPTLWRFKSIEDRL